MHLCAFDRPLQDDASRTKITSLLPPHRFFADVGSGKLEHTGATLRTLAKRLLAAEIGRFRIGSLGPPVAKIELHLVRVGHLELSGEGPPKLTAEAFQRAHCAGLEQGLCLGDVELTAGDDFPHFEVAGLTLEFSVLLVHFAAALRAACSERREVAGNRVAFVVFCLTHDVLRHLDDIAHELLALEFAVLHLRQPELPFGGEFRRKQLRNAQPVQQRHEREGLCGWLELATFAMHIFFLDQPLDNLRTCRRRAKTFLAHRLA